MACYHPLTAYKSRVRDAQGKSSIIFNPTAARDHDKISLPCGQCVGCRLERSRQWAIRCVHEASLHSNNCFITLTFNNLHLPDDRSLDVRHWQLFMKRLRKKYGDGIRFFHCGEYGEQFGRPHYHACLFNFDFPDKYHWKTTKQGHKTFRSSSLEELWPYGMSEIGSVTFESAAYVARYIMKKVNGDRAQDHYAYVDEATGRIFNLKPEYVTMSRRPGLGKGWYEKFSSDVYPLDEVVIRGKKMRPPRYYDKLYELEDKESFEEIKWIREENAKKHLDDNTPERLNVKEIVAESRVRSLTRSL